MKSLSSYERTRQTLSDIALLGRGLETGRRIARIFRTRLPLTTHAVLFPRRWVVVLLWVLSAVLKPPPADHALLPGRSVFTDGQTNRWSLGALIHIKRVQDRGDAVQTCYEQERDMAPSPMLSLLKRHSMAEALLRAGVVWRRLALSTTFIRQVTSDSPRGRSTPICLSQW